jgi:hypothetical protein
MFVLPLRRIRWEFAATISELRMRRTKMQKVCWLLALMLTAPAFAQERNTEHTLKLTDGHTPQAASVADMAWVTGHWVGEGMGGESVEHWGPVHQGRMLGTFTYSAEGKPVFHEFMIVMEVEGHLVVRLKHFNPDLTGWEEKDKFVDFKFIAKKEDAMYFNGLTYVPVGKDAMKIYVALRGKDGQVHEEVFSLKRAR